MEATIENGKCPVFLVVASISFRWSFAYTAILEENIRRRRDNWSWERMKQHRQRVRDYRQAWVRKQTEKSLPHDVAELIDEAEKALDVFNLNIARQQAELEIDRRGLVRLEDQPQGWTAWWVICI